jgi:outer membrane receptor protein involved in Fe transport
MLRVSPAARSRCFGFRRGVFNSVVLPALVIGAVANAQEGAQAPQRQEHETLTAPAQPQQPASGPPAASEVLVPDATAGTTQLPPIVVRGDTPKAKRDSPPQKPVAQSGRTTQRAAQSAPTTQQAAQDAPTPQQAALNTQMTTMNEARDTNILTKIGATTYTFTREAIVSMPQGDNTPIDKLILQFPGVSYDSAASNPNFHVRGEYANVQTRINGVVIPEGVSGLGALIDTNFIAKISLLTGTLPAQYGLRTAGVLDIISRSYATPNGEISLYGGSHKTFTPSFDYGSSVGNTEYFVAGRGNWNTLGIENPTASLEAIHDYTQQGKFFGSSSTMLNESTRLSFITAESYSAFQIPNNPSQAPLGDFGPTSFSSTSLNENEHDTYVVNIAALQKHGTDGDAQVAVYSRYAKVNFIPDLFGDLVFNDVASNVTRESLLNGTQVDAAYSVNDRHTLRAGFATSEEHTNVSNLSAVLPVDPITGAISPTPFNVLDQSSLTGWNIGTYIQDEWKLTSNLTLNVGLRFDQLYQYVDANQFSPRVALVYKPFVGTSIHAGYARYFTPPFQAQAATSNLALFTNTTNQPEVPLADPVKPERSNYYDVGIDQKVSPGLDVGIDVYYKDARDLIDDGQFGQAVVLTQFNWARGYSEGGEFKVKYTKDAYANFAVNVTRAIGPETNQYLLDADEYDYLLTHWHYTDDMQLLTGSGGAWYRWNGYLFTANLIYGSGLRSGFANQDHTPPYVTVNAGMAKEIKWASDAKPITLCFDVVNLFDKIYELRDGSGIGVFAPQFGARRGFFAGVSQKL